MPPGNLETNSGGGNPLVLIHPSHPIPFQGITADDAIASVNSIQTGLFRRYEDQKFLVVCATADEAKNGAATANKVHFSSSGDGYCNVVKERVWCQAVALSA